MNENTNDTFQISEDRPVLFTSTPLKIEGCEDGRQKCKWKGHLDTRT